MQRKGQGCTRREVSMHVLSPSYQLLRFMCHQTAIAETRRDKGGLLEIIVYFHEFFFFFFFFLIGIRIYGCSFLLDWSAAVSTFEIYMWVYKHASVQVYVHTRTRTCTYRHSRKYTHTHKRIQAPTYLHTNKYTHSYTHTNAYALT